ncbi:MAG: shikimate kinase [Desulfuromonadaceae bacterium]
MKKANITLIGMPGAGKSTIGVILAKQLSYGFVDTDVLIQVHQQKTLQQILDEKDHHHLRKIEEAEILSLNIDRHVIATGGSAVYSESGMAHLQRLSTIVFLQVRYEEIKRRIHNFDSRGIAKAKGQTFRALFRERQPLYQRYGELWINGEGFDQEQIAEQIAAKIRGMG